MSSACATDQTQFLADCIRGDFLMPDTDQSTLASVMDIAACPVEHEHHVDVVTVA